jgi:hypothetical protein
VDQRAAPPAVLSERHHLEPQVSVPEVLAAASVSRPFAVKDSFARLDLAPSGFRLLTGASWIACAAPARPADDGLDWDVISSPGELTAWETFSPQPCQRRKQARAHRPAAALTPPTLSCHEASKLSVYGLHAD